MDERFTPQPVARWYVLAAIGSLLIMLVGCGLYAIHLTTDPATLPLDQRALMEAQPGWVPGALGLAAAIGALGSVMLLLRRRAAEPLLLISLLLVAVWVAGLFVLPALRRLLSTNDVAAAVVVALLSWTIYMFARHSRQRAWLR